VKEQPGITISEAVEQMSVQKSYLNRVVAGLEEQGSITRDGKAFVARNAQHGT